ncbi:hypothetical protein [Saccharibacter sp. 17.LH.SD]|uniref:hypothetical protein n=1 Tax=Saccharibacter sp. 17.LH.SD TaxID=2689393 RepID=UPI001927B86D|nr:hypothetical protein [Saccharibacter sp. 17.LH.SD]
MSVEVLPALRSLVESWVVKKTPSTPPRKLSADDLDQLARASIETLAQRALGTIDGEWGSLEELTQGWVVQRYRGATPGPLVEDDFRHCVRFVLEGLSRERPTDKSQPSGEGVSAADEALSTFVPETDDVLPDGRKVADVLREDPFYFAREHLALSL